MKKMKFLLVFIGINFLNCTSNYNQKNDSVEITKIDLHDEFKIGGHVNVIKIKKNTISYKVTNKGHRDYNFYVNSNYFTIDNKPVGEVKIDGKVTHPKNKNGAFFTSDGTNPTFYYGKRPKDVKYSSQTHTPVIVNGVPNYKIFDKKWAKYKLPRLIIGENKHKDIVILHTVGSTVCSVRDFYEISKRLNLVNAFMFDGGASIEVGIKHKNINYKYQIVSDVERKLLKVPTPSVFIVGNFI